jgi:hypothetical protein
MAFSRITLPSIRVSSSSTSPVIINGLSDHDAQYLMINNISAASNFIPLKQRTRKVNNETIMQFHLLLKSETWESVQKTVIPTISLTHFCINIFEPSFPITYKCIGKINNNWIAQGIKISCKHKRSLYINSRNSNDPNTRAFYIKYCKIPNNVIKKAKKQHYSRLIAKSNNKIKTTWNVIKRETGKIHLTEQMASLLTNNEKVKDPGTVANAFNNFFSNNYQKLKFTSSGGDKMLFHF